MTGDPLAWYAILPPDLVQRAYRASDARLAWDELAWTRPDALAVARFVQERGYDVFSIEPWLPTRPGPTPLIDDWAQEDDRGMSAEEFITTFRWTPTESEDAGLEVYFAIDVEPRARGSRHEGDQPRHDELGRAARLL